MLKIKEKMVNGKKVAGLINENLKEVAPFEFESITEVVLKGFYARDFYVCKKEDGTCSVYDSDGNLRLSYVDGYKVLDFLKYREGNAFVVEKNGEVGIISSLLERDRNQNNNVIGYCLRIDYPLTKNISFVQNEDKSVKIIKHLKSGDREAYYYHPQINRTFKPEYLSMIFGNIRCKNGVSLYKLSDGHDRGTPSYNWSEKIEDEKLTLNTEIIYYTKNTKKGEVQGIMQKVYDEENSKYRMEYKFVDFIEGEYSEIRCDEDAQMFHLSKMVDGEKKVGLVGYAFNWTLWGKGWFVWGFPSLLQTIKLDAIYDSYKIVNNKYIIVTLNGKQGLFKYSYNNSQGDYCYDGRTEKRANASLVQIAEPIYDKIEESYDNFIGINGNEKIILVDAYVENDKDKNFLKVDSHFVDYKAISSSVYFGTRENGEKALICIRTAYPNCWYSYEEGTVSMLEGCLDAKLHHISDNSYHFIEVQFEGINKLFMTKAGEFIELEHDIASVVVQKELELIKVVNNDGHISFFDMYGKKAFSSRDLGINITEDTEVSYLETVDMFRVIKDGIVTLYKGIKYNLGQEKFENRIYTDFNECYTRNGRIIGYHEIVEEDVQPGILSMVDLRENCAEKILFAGDFAVSNIVCNGSRIIIKKTDESGNEKYGVIETVEGNVCIDFMYDMILYDSSHEVFVAFDSLDKYIFDKDGFLTKEPSAVVTDTLKKVLV